MGEKSMMKFVIVAIFACFVLGKERDLAAENAKLRETNQALMEALEQVTGETAVGPSYHETNHLGEYWEPSFGWCKWYGSAPYCGWEFEDCPDGTNEECMAAQKSGCAFNHEFGSNCWFGKKKLCCHWADW